MAAEGKALFWTFVVVFGVWYQFQRSMSDTFDELLILALATVFLLVFRRPTTIRVSHDRIVINRKRLDRSAFANFFAKSRLGYFYGERSYEFGGNWDVQKGYEITSALNILLNQTVAPPDPNQKTPEELRATRANDF